MDHRHAHADRAAAGGGEGRDAAAGGVGVAGAASGAGVGRCQAHEQDGACNARCACRVAEGVGGGEEGEEVETRVGIVFRPHGADEPWDADHVATDYDDEVHLLVKWTNGDDDRSVPMSKVLEYLVPFSQMTREQLLKVRMASLKAELKARKIKGISKLKTAPSVVDRLLQAFKDGGNEGGDGKDTLGADLLDVALQARCVPRVQIAAIVVRRDATVFQVGV